MSTKQTKTHALVEPPAGEAGRSETEVDVVIAHEVSKSFGEAHALQSCTLTARAGEIHAVVGENGSGKSTLAKVLAGVLPPDAGTVSVNGRHPQSPLEAHELGLAMVFQEILVSEGATVLDNLYLGHDGLVRAKLSLRQKRAKARELLERLSGAPVDLDRLVDDLPLSMRQWIVIARALLLEPRVIVFDESTAALDHASVERFFTLVRELKESGVCVLIVTHRINELTEVCDRVTVLSDGRDVGTLLHGDITEARLLKMMSGAGRVEARAEAARRTRANGTEVLAASQIKLSGWAEPFDLSVHRGEIVGLAGLEGQGQVEFIKAVTGIRRLAAGQIEIANDGRRTRIESAKAADRAGISYIPGDRKVEGTFSNLSIFENFGVGLYRRTARVGFIARRRIHRVVPPAAREPVDPRGEADGFDQLAQRREPAEDRHRPLARRRAARARAQRPDARRRHRHEARPLRPAAQPRRRGQDDPLPLQRDRGVRRTLRPRGRLPRAVGVHDAAGERDGQRVRPRRHVRHRPSRR